MGDTFVNTISNKFEKMQYGPSLNYVNESIDWIAEHNFENLTGDPLELKTPITNQVLCTLNIPNVNTFEQSLNNWTDSKTKWIDINSTQRTDLLFKLGNEIEKQSVLFSEIEAITRGILIKNTKKKTLPLLSSYFHYYSSFTAKYTLKNPAWKPSGLAVGIFGDDAPSVLLAYFLAPALAAGYNVILLTSPTLAIAAHFLKSLAVKIGIPENTIHIVPENVNCISAVFESNKVSVISIFDDLCSEKYALSNHLNKKILNLSTFVGTPLIIFDGADLDSACESVIDAIWGSKCLVPGAVTNVFVQENIYNDFIAKVKQRIDSIEIGHAFDLNVDISHSINSDDNLLDDVFVEKAQRSSGEIVKLIDKKFERRIIVPPILLIGGNFFENSGNADNKINASIASVTCFRTINEAANLANNSRQGLAASIWTENISVANEIVKKLQVTTVWINSHGLFDVSIPLSPMKTSGQGYFGGPQGFYEYVNGTNSKIETTTQFYNNDSTTLEKIIREAQKAQISWSKLSRTDRSKQLQIIAQTMNAKKDSLSKNLPEEWLNDWMSSIYYYISENLGNIAIEKQGFNISTNRVAKEILIIETNQNLEVHNKKLIIVGLLEGCAILIFNESIVVKEYYEQLSKLLPKGVLNVLDLTDDAIRMVALFKELPIYFGERIKHIISSLPVRDSCKFKKAHEDWTAICDQVTYIKSVWSDNSKSFI